MVLEQFSISATPITTFLNSLTAQLLSVVDNNNKPLNQSVRIGIDAVLQSAIDGQPSADDMPCCRIFYDPHNIRVDNAQHIGLYLNIPISIYWLFALDYPSPNFAELREDFIRWNLNYLKTNQFSDGIGMPIFTWWKWNDDPIVITHNTQLKYLGKYIDITPDSNFSCSRVDLSVMMKNYLGSDDRQLT